MTNMMRKIERLQVNKRTDTSPKGYEVRYHDIRVEDDENSDNHKTPSDKTKERDQKNNRDTVRSTSGACGRIDDMIKDREQTRTSMNRLNLKERIERFNETMKKHEGVEKKSTKKKDDMESEKKKVSSKGLPVGGYEEASESEIDKLESERALLKHSISGYAQIAKCNLEDSEHSYINEWEELQPNFIDLSDEEAIKEVLSKREVNKEDKRESNVIPGLQLMRRQKRG